MTSWYTQHIPVLAASTASTVAAAGVIVWWVLTHRKTAEEKERERRDHLVLHGRIIDGTILDWSEQPDTSNLGTLLYRYSISGASYECAQDVSFLQDTVPVSASCLGTPASVRYDPKNPANSIIVSESWSGLRYTDPDKV
ncbi:MAG: hypothetical protein ABI076_07860 [Acidobacteriaceae bacterium]